MKILLAEADEMTALMARTLLSEWGYEVIVVQTGDEACESLSRDEAIQLALLNWELPGVSGPEVCRRLRAAANEPYRYLMLLTAQGEKVNLNEAWEAGADDFVVLPLEPQTLRVRLRAARRVLEMQTQLQFAQAMLHRQAIHDPLTRLWNRTAIMEIFWQELARAKRERGRLAIAMAGIDNFPQILATNGRLAADTVLHAVAERASSALRVYDRMARYDEQVFLFILPRCDAFIGLQVMERVRGLFKEHPINTSEGLVPVSLSIGVTAWEGDGPVSQEEMLRAAEAGMARARQAGGNRVELVMPDSDELAVAADAE